MAGTISLTPKCAKCGSCAQVCPVYLVTGRESHCARGKLHLFAKGVDYSSDYCNDLLSKCIQCGACDDICPRDLQPSLIIRQLRSGQSTGQAVKGYESFLTRQILKTPSLLNVARVSLALLKKLPTASGLRQKINILIPHKNEPIPQPKTSATEPLLYYPGCLAHHFQTDIEQATRYLASLCGYTLIIPDKATCCGISSSSSGKQQEAQQQALRNIKAYSSEKGTILTSCGSCYAQLKSYPALFTEGTEHHHAALQFADRVEEFSTFFCKQALRPIRQAQGSATQGDATSQRVYYHDPCHLRFADQPIINEPRQLIRNINGQGVVNGDNELGCCGQGGLFGIINPTLSAEIFKQAEKSLRQTQESDSINTEQTTVVTSCSSCLLGWQQHTENTEISAQHLSVFLAKRCKNC